MTFDEKRWLKRFRRNEPGCFDALYVEYGPRLYRFCYHLSGHTAEAEDLTQEVFVAAYQGLSEFKERASLATWLYRIALFRWHARCRNTPTTLPLDETHSAAANLSDPARVGLARVALDQALAALPENLREAFLLVKAEGLRCSEAAAVLRIPEGTLKYHVHQAVVKLRALMEEEPQPDAPSACIAKVSEVCKISEVCNEM